MSRAVAACVVVLLLASAAGEAWARARTGGSRGSRSYAEPARRAPVSPASPTSPARRVESPSPSPAPRPGGMLGGLMGALSGFVLGGLLGSLLFGGGVGGGPGFGLMDMLLVGGALFLLFRFLRSRSEPQPAYAGAAYASGAGSVADAPRGGVQLEDPPRGLDELERGLSHIRRMDGSFDAAGLASAAAETFRAVQAALTAGDMTPLTPRLTPEMFERLQTQCTELARSGHTNRVERVQIQYAEVTEGWQERGRDYVTVALGGTLVDYAVDRTGAVVAGSRTPERFEEYWTFTRPVGPNAWRLTAIQAG